MGILRLMGGVACLRSHNYFVTELDSGPGLTAIPGHRPFHHSALNADLDTDSSVMSNRGLHKSSKGIESSLITDNLKTAIINKGTSYHHPVWFLALEYNLQIITRFGFGQIYLSSFILQTVALK